MAGGQDAGGSGDVSYGDRGGDNIEELTKYDENEMDRTAQAGVSGAFGAAEGAEETRETLREDAESAFGDDQGGGTASGS
jgi:hypothetical protein